MATTRVLEAIDVLQDGGFGFPAGFPSVPPDQFSLDGFDEGFNGGVVIAVAFSAHPLPGSGC